MTQPERSPLRRRLGGTGAVAGLALGSLLGAACEPCESVVEADTGIPSTETVRLIASWCDADACIVNTVDSDQLSSPVPRRFQLTDRGGRWFVELVGPPPKKSEFGPATLEIREEGSSIVLIRASSNYQSDDGCVFLSAAAPSRP